MVTVEHYVFLVFFLNIATGDLYALLAALVSPHECLYQSAVERFLTSPIPLLLGGLLGEGEDHHLPLHPQVIRQQ